MGTVEVAAGPRHGQEVARLLEKAQRTKVPTVVLTLGTSVLLPLGGYLAFGGIAGVLGGFFGLALLGCLPLILGFQSDARKRLKAHLGRIPPVAFISSSHGYVFISEEGVFNERDLAFMSFEGSPRIGRFILMDHARFNGTRTLSLDITHHLPRHRYRSAMLIDVPLDVPVEPLRLLSTAVEEGRVRRVLAELSGSGNGSRRGSRGRAGRKRRRQVAGAGKR